MKSITKIVFGLLVILNSTTTFATEQAPDLVIYNCDTFYISQTFNEYFPLYEILNDELYKSKFNFNEDCFSEACFRQYRATWVVEKGEIYLRELKYCCSNDQYDLKSIFGRKAKKKKGVKAFWINGNFGFSSHRINIWTLYEDIKFIDLNVKKGKILDVKQS